MPEQPPQENQQELFGSFSTEARRPERIPSISKTQKPIFITTSMEQILLISIVSILGLCLVFFLGVLRGKAIADKPEMILPRNTAIQAPAPPPVTRPAPKVVMPKLSPLKSRSIETTPIAATASNLVKPYTIQLSTTKKKAQAESDVDALRKAGYYTMIIPSGEYYQVCVGFYANKAEAKKDLDFFKTRYKGCYLRRR